MGFFKSEEEKRAKQDEKINKIMLKYGLNELDNKYKKAVTDINSELSGTDFMELGNMLSYDEKTAARLNTYYTNALIQQNWIIIRQLNDLIHCLKTTNSNNDEIKSQTNEDDVLANLISRLENENK